MCECKSARPRANFLVLQLISAVREVGNITLHMIKGIPELDSLAGKCLSVADGQAGEQELESQQEEEMCSTSRRHTSGAHHGNTTHRLCEQGAFSARY